MKVLAVVQARIGSSRFPGKVLAEVKPGLSIIELILGRLKASSLITDLVVAIPQSPEENKLALHLKSLGVDFYRGSAQDVQSRFVECGELHSADLLVRITGDCPLTDPDVVDALIAKAIAEDLDYCSNVSPPTMPDGLDVEVFKLTALIRSRSLDSSRESMEHVTVHLRESGLFKVGNVTHDMNLSNLRWTVDYPEDLEQISKSLPGGFEKMGWLSLLQRGFSGVVNSSAMRNEGFSMSEGQKLWSRAKSVIPGGSMLLSKRPEMFLPEKWPTYYAKAKGIEIHDLDGNKYFDFSTMSVGTCSLGYGNSSVDAAVIEAVHDGVMSTLNSPAEVALAERLVSLHPWSGMARFARSGGEANAIAVRIARAHTGKDKIAICGYHGWHDWYLAANLGESSNLDGHLLPGLDPAGVPRALRGTTSPFAYNKWQELEALLRTGEFAAVQMEVSRNFGPAEGFLEKVRELCDFYGAVLIFDECTSGFRETFGGLHLKYGVEPDIAMFGKAMGNGYAITAVVGSSHVMQSAQSTFVSSTFWTERLGPVAALATLEEMERLRSWELIPATGRAIKDVWRDELSALGFTFTISGLDALPTFAITSPHWLAIKTLFTQEMLKLGYLAAGGFYSSTAHGVDDLEGYRKAFRAVMSKIAEDIDEARIVSLLEGPVAHSGFARLN